MALKDVYGTKPAKMLAERGKLGLWSETSEAHQDRQPHSPYRYVIFSNFEDCAHLWREFEENALFTPFQSFNWLENWWRAYCREEQNPTLNLQIIFVYRNERLALILPMVIEQFRSVRRLSWLCSHLSDYTGPLIARSELDQLDDAVVERLWQDICAQFPAIDMLFLPKQPHEIAGVANPFYRFHAHDYRLQYHRSRIGGDWQTYYTGRRKGKSRSRLKSKEKALRKSATITLGEIFDAGERARVVRQTIDWKQTQVRMSGAIDPFDDVETEHFFDAVARAPEYMGDFRVFSLTANGEPVACAFGLNAPEGFILYQTAYDAGPYTRYSPGVLLLLHMMEKMADEDRKIFDFSIGDEPYKFDWADEHEDLLVSIRALTLKGQLARLFVLSKLGLKGWVKSSERRFEFVKSIRRRLLELKS